MKKSIFSLLMALTFVAFTAMAQTPDNTKESAQIQLDKCPLKGTPDCPLIKNCPKKGTADCPYKATADNSTTASLENCPLKGTPDCPLVKNCPKKGQPDCPYKNASSSTDSDVATNGKPSCCKKGKASCCAKK